MFIFKVFLWLLSQLGVLGFQIYQLLKVLCILFKNWINILLSSYVGKSTQKMLSQEVIFGLYIIQGSFILFIEGFVLFERVVNLIVLLMELEPVFHDKFFSLCCLFKIKDFHFTSKFLELSSGGDEIIFEWLYDLLTVFDSFFEFFDLFELNSKSLLEGIEMLWLFGLFCGTVSWTVIRLCLIKRYE